MVQTKRGVVVIRIIVFLCLLNFAGAQSASPDCPNPVVDWVHLGTGIHDITVDDNDHIFVVGDFSGLVDFDPTEGVDLHESPVGKYREQPAIFVSKFGSDGTYHWTRTVGGDLADEGWGVATDRDGSVYVSGFFHTTVDFDPTEGVDERTVLGGLINTKWFIMKLFSDGSYAGTMTPGDNIGGSSAQRIVLDGSGNIYFAGNLSGELDFDPGEGVDIHSSDGASTFVTKIMSDGSYGWTRVFGGNRSSGWGIAVDSFGDVIVAGVFRGLSDFDPSEGVDLHSSVRTFGDIFVTKFRGDGSYDWTATFAGFLAGNFGDHLAITPGDEIVVTGSFDMPFDFDPTNDVDFRVPFDDPAGLTAGDIFITKLFADGSYGWTYAAGGPEGEGGQGITTDRNGDVLVTGWFRGPVDFDAGPDIEEKIPVRARDVFVMKLSGEGSYVWSRAFGSNNEDFGRNVALDKSGNVIATGTVRRNVDFDEGCDVDFFPDGGSYIVKMICIQKTADANGDGFVDLFDYFEFQSCLSGPAPTVCNEGCEIFDFDHDDDIDLVDYLEFLAWFE